MRTFLTGALLLSLATAAFAADPPSAGWMRWGEGAKDPAAASPPQAQPVGVAKVVVVRTKSIAAAGLKFGLTFDGRELPGLRTGRHLEFEAPAGAHVVAVKCFGGWSPTTKTDSAHFTASDGQTLYFKIRPGGQCAVIERIQEPEAQELLVRSRLVDTE